MNTPKSQGVFWIGGSYSGGKSTTCRILAERHEIEPYHYDRHLLGDPLFKGTMVKDDAWFWQQNELKFERYRRAFPFAIGQIEAIAESAPVLAEGPGLLPELLHRRGIRPGRVLYLLPTPGFQRTVNRLRGAWVDEVLARKPEDQLAWDSWMKLDEEFANLIEISASRCGYRVIRNDGSKSPLEIAQIAQQHFGLGESR